MAEIEVNLAEERTSPLGLWMFADSYLDAASCVMAHGKHPHRIPVYFLSGQAIALALKAYLRAENMSIEEIQRTECRLGPLMDLCQERGLREPEHMAKAGRAAIELLDLGEADSRYIRTGFKRRPDLAALRLFAEWLLNETKTRCVPCGVETNVLTKAR